LRGSTGQPTRFPAAASHPGKLSRFGFHLPPQITVHLDAGYDSSKTRTLLTELGCEGVISTKGEPLQAGARRVDERTNSWHTRGSRKLLICTERMTKVIDAMLSLANSIIVLRRPVREVWYTQRWDARPKRKP
jgi:hypothetical protein